jgi:hypothetical protein
LQNRSVMKRVSHKLKPGGEAMNADYVFLCGVMWAQYGSEDACRELLRALHSEDPDVVLLACALLERTTSPANRQSSRDLRTELRATPYKSSLDQQALLLEYSGN